MLVCPQCQFENPEDNRFCQQCGTSLAEKICPACGESAPVEAKQCPYCQADIAFTLRAVLLPRTPLTGAVPTATDSPPVSANAYLDSQQRYRLLDPLPATLPANGAEVLVMDCTPLQPSPLELLVQQLDKEATAADGDDGQEPVIPADVLAIAQTYLELEQQLYPSIPRLHDAWSQNGHMVLLLEDRSDLMPLTELWSDPHLPPFQILHLLHQMTELWVALEEQQCARSLLEVQNLRVDEDQLVYLQRLYSDGDTPPPLTGLGQVWRSLLQKQAARDELAPLLQLAADVEMAQVKTCDAVRSRLAVLAETLQPDNSTMPGREFSDLAPKPMAEAEIDEVNRKLMSAGADLSFANSPTQLDLTALADDDSESSGDTDDVPTIVLPMKLVSLEDAGRSDIGRQRDHNEDCFSIQTDIKKVEGINGRTLWVKGLYILCDGMGGHAGGEVASALAVETLQNFFQEHWQDQLPSEDTIRQGILAANQAIFDLNQQDDRAGSARMGTTLVMLLVQDTRAMVAHVGDSRLYRLSRRRGLEQITTDHEVGQREIQRGVEPAIAYARPDAYQLTQALGPRENAFVLPDVQFLELNEDALLLLCSDGLSDNNLLETHWRSHLEPLLSSQTNLETGVNQLIDLANQYNGHDNITAIAIRNKVRPNLEQSRYA
ncbi:MAG TPA: serine/threonine phosphatase [Synechococcales cyanobacterium M55_K2018_004]|nr:serine/threonine phosphatase [Synechococcales cyanobacterium M55_K2018_004]